MTNAITYQTRMYDTQKQGFDAQIALQFEESTGVTADNFTPEGLCELARQQGNGGQLMTPFTGKLTCAAINDGSEADLNGMMIVNGVGPWWVINAGTPNMMMNFTFVEPSGDRIAGGGTSSSGESYCLLGQR